MTGKLWWQTRRGAFGALVLVVAACDSGAADDRFADGPLPEALHPSLERLETLGRNGMRVSISPSFGQYGFVADFVPQPLDCYLPGRDFDEERYRREGCGIIAVRYTLVGRDEEPEPRVRRFAFHVPEEEYRVFVGEFDRLAGRWRGSDGGVLDGTRIGVEQYREGRLRSMSSNAPALLQPENPAAQAGLHVQRLLLAYGPAGAVPRSSSFTIEPRSEAETPCTGQSFATPDPDGFGTGEDSCARALAQAPARR